MTANTSEPRRVTMKHKFISFITLALIVVQIVMYVTWVWTYHDNRVFELILMNWCLIAVMTVTWLVSMVRSKVRREKID